MPPKAETVNWHSVETWERLVASMFASGYKPDLNAVAGYYGCTYDTLQNRFRPIKKDAEALKAEHKDEDGKQIIPVPVNSKATPRKPRTPKKDTLDTVTGGRVAKKTPTKTSARKKTVKKESDDEVMAGSDRDAHHVEDDELI